MIDFSISNEEILKFAMENGILNSALVKDTLEMQKRKDILAKHPYSIWEGKDGYWYTYLPNGNKRKMIKRRNKADVEIIIVDYWGPKLLNTFKERFQIWKDRQKKCGRSDNTISKYESDYKRFFEGDKIENLLIQNISDEDISEFIQRILSKKNIPYRALKSMFGYMNGVFEKARMDKIIENNPCQYIDLPLFRQYCTETKMKSAKERTMSMNERKILENKLNNAIKKNDSNIVRYAVALSLYTGMRVGELAGLKWEDIDYDNGVINICRSEKYNRKTKQFFISSTKNDKVRSFPLTEEIINILANVKKAEIKNNFLSEFVFSDNNGRIHARRISECARNMTMTKEFENTKSIHAIRRTFNSNLRCNGVSATVAASLLGHTERVNQDNYTYDVSSVQEKRKAVQMAGKIS